MSSSPTSRRRRGATRLGLLSVVAVVLLATAVAAFALGWTDRLGELDAAGGAFLTGSYAAGIGLLAVVAVALLA